MALLYAIHGCLRAPVAHMVITWLLFAAATTLIPFGWIVPTIYRYTESTAWTTTFSLFYILLFQSKFLLVLVAARLLAKPKLLPYWNPMTTAAIVAAADCVAPELFPWSWGNAVAAQPWLRQLASLASVYAIAFAAALTAGFLQQLIRHGPALRSKEWQLIFAKTTLLWLFGGIFYHGQFFSPKPTGQKLRILVVQTNLGVVRTREAQQMATRAQNSLLRQSLEGAILRAPLDTIIWPEGSLPFHSTDSNQENIDIYSPSYDAVIEYIQRSTGAALIYHDLFRQNQQLYSRLVVRPQSGQNYYLKRRLVPWGEYLPFENELPVLREIFPEAGKFHAAKLSDEILVPLSQPKDRISDLASHLRALQVLRDGAAVRKALPALPQTQTLTIKPLLCYEALYPEEARTQSAELLVNLASDAWFGDGLEGAQHAAAAALRAVENGIPMVRAALTGVSFIADARGEFVVRPTAQAREENLFAEIPLGRRQTVFAQWGMKAFWLFVGLCTLPGMLWLSTKRSSHNF